MKTSLPLFFARARHVGFRSGLVTGLVALAAVFGVTNGVDAQTAGRVYKWDQPPQLTVPTNVFYGWNEKSVTFQQVAADDWVCTTTNPVTKIRWWGSFMGWNYDDATPVLPADFRIHFWTDQPKVGTNTFSHPLQVLWQVVCTNFTWRCAGKDYDPRTGTFETCFVFEQNLNMQDWFYQYPLTGTNIFWISIAANYPQGAPAYPFGMKTRVRSPKSPAPDAAVDIFSPNNPLPGLFYISGVPITWPTTNDAWDLAFELYSAQSVTAVKWEQVPDLSTNGMDVNATFNPAAPTTNLLADDFLCATPGPITNITIWGSWTNDFDMNSSAIFTLSIHDDIASNNPSGYSMPGPVRWVWTFSPGQYTVSTYASGINEWWFTPTNRWRFPGDHICYQYDFNIPPMEAFWQEGTPSNPKVYWLDVQAQLQPAPFYALFGWKTCPTNWNDDAVWVNAIEQYAGLWNELTYPPPHPRHGQTVDLAFRLYGGAGEVSLLKWSQPPLIATNIGNWYNGWNEPSIYGGGISTNGVLTNIVADDWLCTNSRPVSDIHWWGSFLGWTGTNLPSQSPAAFHLAIWRDVPAGGNEPFSHPGEVIWERVVSVTETNFKWTKVGWDIDPRAPCADIETCFKFDYSLPGTNDWWMQESGTNIYWLSISAMYSGGDVIPNPFGWKTRPHRPVPPDDAVRIFEPLTPSPGLVYVFGEPIEHPAGTSWDMAFRLTSCQPSPTYSLTNLVFTNISVVNLDPNYRRVTIQWRAFPDTVYQLQETTSLGYPPITWTDVGDPVVAPGNAIVFTNTMDRKHFYRFYLPDVCP